MKNTKSRLAFNFYESYYEIINELNDKQKILLIDSLLAVQFLKVNIDDVSFSDKFLILAWKSMYHSIKKQLEGYCNSKSILYSSLFTGTVAYEGTTEGTYEGTKVQGEEEGEGQEEEEGATPSTSTYVSDATNSTDALEVSEYLLEKILEWKPNFKKPSNLNRWTNDISKAIRIDNRNKDELLNAIDWIHDPKGNGFWQPNILSGEKLRRQYDKIEAQAMKG